MVSYNVIDTNLDKIDTNFDKICDKISDQLHGSKKFKNLHVKKAKNTKMNSFMRFNNMELECIKIYRNRHNNNNPITKQLLINFFRDNIPKNFCIKVFGSSVMKIFSNIDATD